MTPIRNRIPIECDSFPIATLYKNKLFNDQEIGTGFRESYILTEIFTEIILSNYVSKESTIYREFTPISTPPLLKISLFVCIVVAPVFISICAWFSIFSYSTTALVLATSATRLTASFIYNYFIGDDTLTPSRESLLHAIGLVVLLGISQGLADIVATFFLSYWFIGTPLVLGGMLSEKFLRHFVFLESDVYQMDKQRTPDNLVNRA